MRACQLLRRGCGWRDRHLLLLLLRRGEVRCTVAAGLRAHSETTGALRRAVIVAAAHEASLRVAALLTVSCSGAASTASAASLAAVATAAAAAAAAAAVVHAAAAVDVVLQHTEHFRTEACLRQQRRRRLARLQLHTSRRLDRTRHAVHDAYELREDLLFIDDYRPVR